MEEQKKVQLTVYVTEEEKNQIKEEARECGKDLSQYFKQIYIQSQGTLKEIKTNDLTEYAAEIYSIGNKIQGILNIAARTNAIYKQDIERTNELLEEINKKAKEILEKTYELRREKRKRKKSQNP